MIRITLIAFLLTACGQDDAPHDTDHPAEDAGSSEDAAPDAHTPDADDQDDGGVIPCTPPYEGMEIESDTVLCAGEVTLDDADDLFEHAAGLGATASLDTHIPVSTVSHMKTTIDLPDDLVVEAKKRAAELRVPLRRLVEEGLRARLAPPEKPRGPRRRVRIPWVTVEGGLPPGLDIADRARMGDWLGLGPR